MVRRLPKPITTLPEVMGNEINWVVKSNKFIEARYDMSVVQNRIIILLISKLDRFAEDFGTQILHASEFKELSGQEGWSVYAQLEEAAQQLVEQRIHIAHEKGWTKANLLSFVTYHKNKGCIEARFNPDMRPLLLKLQGYYTKYQAKQVMQLSSPYSIRLYEQLKMRYEQAKAYGKSPVFEIEVSYLREILNLEDKYDRFSDFRRRVIDFPTKEINEHTDLSVSYATKKRGREVHAIVFQVSEKRETLPAKKPQSKPGAQADMFSASKDPYELWLDGLTEEERARLEEEACARIVDLADTPGVRMYQIEQAQRMIYQERIAAASSQAA